MKNRKAHGFARLSRTLIPQNRSAQMEMSVGTIVTIVLLVTVLILGVVLIKNIFTSAKSVVDMTDQQLRNQIDQLFSSDSKVAIYPDTVVNIKQEEQNGVGIGIKNLLTGVSGNAVFSYVVTASDSASLAKCGVDETTAESWIATGRTADNINIASGDTFVGRVLFNIPVGAPLCIIRYTINVKDNGQTYASSNFFDISIQAK
jgi:hypothetical protein